MKSTSTIGRATSMLRPATPARRAIARVRAAFTLVELLIVIAIISILIGLLFPVFATVMENSRQANTMSQMQQIGSALALYKLDNKRYPAVLFAYAKSGDTMATIGSDTAASANFGLYPTYIKDWHVFTSPDNLDDQPGDTVSADVNTFGGSGTLTVTPQTFYKMDAYDVSPQVTGVNLTDPNGTDYVVRYQTSWTNYATADSTKPYPDSRCFPSGYSDAAGNCQSTDDPDYTRQLRWSDPPPNTYVTCTTDHVSNANKVLVMYLDGSVHKINFLDGWQSQPNVPSLAIDEADFIDNQTSIDYDGTNQSQAHFWRTTATH